ncbi:MAG: hypothetical protein HGA70_07035 [Chlorobiaceae bacterium]|nr:hypothetical protein [Chlorobiaceae bacterium]
MSAGDEVAILFMTHKWSNGIASRFTRLWAEMSQTVKCFLLVQDGDAAMLKKWEGHLKSIGAGSALVIFNPGKLESGLGYRCLTEKGLVPGSAHYPVIAFSLLTAYKYYWLIEYDVEYRGFWPDFFDKFSNCDTALLGSHMQTYEEYPNWILWKHLSYPSAVTVDRQDLRKAFLPVYRISREALMCIHRAHLSSWQGHFEVLVPTVLRLNGLSMMNLNEVFPCYLGTHQDFCTDTALQSTVRYFPDISFYEFVNREIAPLLFHPVKQDWTFLTMSPKSGY